MTAAENDARRLMDALKSAGFTVAGAGWGFVRVGWPGRGDLCRFTVDDTDPQYAGLLAAAVEVLRAEASRGEAARHALELHRQDGIHG